MWNCLLSSDYEDPQYALLMLTLCYVNVYCCHLITFGFCHKLHIKWKWGLMKFDDKAFFISEKPEEKRFCSSFQFFSSTFGSWPSRYAFLCYGTKNYKLVIQLSNLKHFHRQRILLLEIFMCCVNIF